MTKHDLEADPSGLFYEAYRMDIGIEDCRTIFFDWAIGGTRSAGPSEIGEILSRYGNQFPDHPMTSVLNEGLRNTKAPKRRGGVRRNRGSMGPK